tara:strand:+ start:2776 stop:6108 length:3333 start_codon:yes stop_codon:yes gene_type:complete
MVLIRGAGGGGKGGNNRTPTEADDSLQSIQHAKVLDLIAEGPIQGLDNQSYPLNSIFLDGTPIQNAAGEDRFDSGSYSVIYDRLGTQNQSYISDLEGTSVEQGVGASITKTNPPATATQQIGDSTNSTSIDKIRVTISFSALQKFEDDGDIVENSVDLKIQIAYNGASFQDIKTDTVTGKSSASYKRDYLITPTPWNGQSGGSSNWPIQIKVVRISDDATNKNVSSFSWASYTKISDEKLSYPNSALMYLRFDASSFNSIPQRKYFIRGLKINIPHNGSVDTTTHIGRVTYSGLFNGTVNNLQWTNDPAWCLWDLLTNTRYGCSIPASSLDAFDFYKISQYCNELVSNGRGGVEPRFSCNMLINSKAEVHSAIQSMTAIFRGMSFYSAGSLVALCDKPRDSQYVLGPSNVVDGVFQYQGSSQKSRHTVVSVGYQDYDGLGDSKIEYVEDASAIAKYGIIPTQIQALGCYSQGQARRLGKWMLLSEQNLTQTVSFSVDISSGIILRPGMVIDIADPTKAGRRRFGRISSATTTAITVDSDTDLSSVDMSESPTVSVLLPTGLVETKTITGISNTTISISGSFSEAPNAGQVWLIQTSGMQSQQFNVVAVTESGEGIYSITALEYNSTIYDAIENDLKVEHRDISDLNDAPGTVSGLDGEQYLYQRGQGVFVGFGVSWTAPTTGGPPTNYTVAYRMSSDGTAFNNWQTLITQSPSVNLENLAAGTLQVKVQALNFTGKGSAVVSKEFTLTGKEDPPGDVQNLTFESINQNSGRLRWDQSVDLDVKVGGKIFIRHSSATDGSGTWSNSSNLIEAKAGNATEAVIPKLEGEVLVKFADSSGITSTNEASVIISLAEKNQRLIVQTQREDTLSPTPFAGTKTNTEYDSSSNVLQLTSSGGNVNSSGSYAFAAVLDLEHTYALDISRYFVTRGNFLNDLMDNWPDVDARTDWDGVTADKVNAAFELRLTTDDPSSSPTWGNWMPCANGTFNGRGFQFRTNLTSSSTDQNILVDQLGYIASLDQRTEQSAGLVASGTSGSGKSLTFDKAFFTGTSSLLGANSRLPSIGIVAQNMASGDYYNVTSVSATGFTVIFKNSSNNPIDRSFYWTAVGFGRRA